ncbi:MAG: complex I NDUFA9 subunit family protein [Burkholderiales bacterium]|nr:complex I NDUFA9 subunit family protein [Anaerolineae bacterium]
MTILVTGAAGYVGNNTVRRLLEQGKPVRAMVRDMAKARQRLSDIAGRLEIVQGDVTDREGLRPLMRDVNTVVHTVAIPMEKGGATYEDINYQGTINVVDAAEAMGVRRFINISQNGASSASPYRFLKSKGRAQEYVASSRLQWTAMRPSAIFGPQDEFFNSIARLVKLTPVIFPLIGGGTAQFQPVSIDDVVEAVARSVEDDKTVGKEFGLGGPEVLSLGEIERRILQAMGERRTLVSVGTGLLRVPVFIMEKTLPGSPVNTSLLDLLAVPNTVPENALVDYFGMTPKPFSGDNIAYLRQNSAASAFKKIFKGATIN